MVANDHGALQVGVLLAALGFIPLPAFGAIAIRLLLIAGLLGAGILFFARGRLTAAFAVLGLAAIAVLEPLRSPRFYGLV